MEKDLLGSEKDNAIAFCPICKGPLKPYNNVRECSGCKNRFFILRTFKPKQKESQMGFGANSALDLESMAAAADAATPEVKDVTLTPLDPASPQPTVQETTADEARDASSDAAAEGCTECGCTGCATAEEVK